MRASYNGITSDFQSDDRSSILLARSNFVMKTYSDIQSYIKNKNVAIVGNAKSIFNNEDGIFIDRHEVVIRMNYGYVFNTKTKRWMAERHLGTKTDIVCAGNAMNIYNQLHQYPNVKSLVHLSGANRRKEDIFRLKKEGVECIYYPLEEWETLKNLLTARPSAGMMVFDIVSKSNPKHVNMFGFDWKKTITYYNEHETVKDPIGPHHWGNERLYIMEQCKMNNWDIL